MTKLKKRFSLKTPIGIDKPIQIAVIGLALFGMIMVSSAVMGADAANYRVLIRNIAKQLVVIVIGLVGMFCTTRFFTFDYAKKKLEILIWGTAFLLVFALSFRGSNGAHAWIRIVALGIEFTIQPSEFAKISIIVILAVCLGNKKIENIHAKDLLKKPLGILFMYVLIIVVLQSDMGSGVVLFLIAVVLLLIPQHKALHRFQSYSLVLLTLGLIMLVFLLSPMGETFLQKLPIAQFQINRFLAAINPFQDKYSHGYQLIRGLTSFASGGMTGVGLGGSIQKYMNFFAAETDYILAIVVEELGFLGFLVIFFGYMIIVYRLFNYAFKIQSEKARMVLVGVAMYLIIHFLFNVGGVTGLIPLTGVPLLLISEGGSSTISFMMAIGVTQAIIWQYHQGQIQ